MGTGVLGDLWPRVKERQALARTPAEQTTAYFNEHATAVIRVLAATFPSQHVQDIEDAVQEGFLSLYTTLTRGKEVEDPVAWVYIVAKNQVLGSIRRAKYRNRVYGQVLEFIVSQMTSSGVISTPERVLLDRSRWQVFEESFSSLSELERWCLRQRAAGRTFAEMGRKVDLDLRRVSEVTARAIQRLNGKLCG